MMISTTELSMANAVAHGGFGGFILQFYCENCGNRYFRILEMREKSGNRNQDVIIEKTYFLRCQRCGSIISGILNYIAAIPPLVFWGSVVVVVAMVTIFGYSLTWCMARNLQDSDWGSDTATAIAFAAIAFAAIAFAAFAFAAIALPALVLALADNPKSSWYYVFRFVGAYLNYRKRTKATPTTSVVEETKE